MSISARARIKADDMPVDERPLSEQYRVVAKQWAEARKGANMMEELKSSTLARIILRIQSETTERIPQNRAEVLAKASDEYREYITRMVDARYESDLAYVKMQWIEHCISEWQSKEATHRAERRLVRETT